MYSLTFSYAPGVGRRYYITELWRTQGGVLLAIPLAVAVSLWASRNPDFWWFAGFVGGVTLIYSLGIYQGYRHADRWMTDQPIAVTIDEAALRMDTESVSGIWRWSSILSVRRTPDFLILRQRRTSRPILLPTTVLSTEASAFVIQRVRDAGGRSYDGA